MSNNLFKRTGNDDFPLHMKVMVSGPPKSGKTTLLGTVPGIIVLDTEPHANNLESIAHKDVPYVTITNSDDLRQVAFMLKDETLRKQVASQYGMPDIKAVAIDTLDTLQKILKDERLKENRATQFLRDDWGWLKTEMEAIVELFTALPMHVFFMVHTKTKEMGKGDDSYTVTLPGLEGSIAESIAGMVGYSLLSFRKEEIDPTGKVYTKYWLRTEGDATHDFLGTRTAGRLPTIIEPNMATIHKAIMDGRPKRPAAPAPTPTAAPTTEAEAPIETPTEAPAPETVAQNPGQSTAPEAAEPAATPAPTTATSAPGDAEKPAGEEPINAAALGHVKKVYEALEIAFPEALVTESVNMGQARDLVKMWRAIQQDHIEGKGPVGMSPQGEMIEYLNGQGWIPEDGPDPVEPAPEVEPKVDGTIEQVMAYVGSDLSKVQVAYDLEVAKDSPRSSLITKLENLGAKTQTAVENSTPAWVEKDAPTEVTQPEPTADAVTEEEAQQAVQEGLGGTVVSQDLNADAPCDACGKPIDDLDLAEVGKKRFNKVLCVEDYLAQQRAK